MKLSDTAKKKIAEIDLTLDQAVKLVNPSDPFLNNMIKALQLLPWHNTPDDWKRLKAGVMVQANKNRIYYDGPKNGYRVKR